MPTKQRIARVEEILSYRQSDLHVVLERLTNTHNASAMVRTCDAAGVLHVDLIYPENEVFPVNKAISTRAEKWLHLSRYTLTSECLKPLKQQGFCIAATHLGPTSIPYTDVDYAQPIAIVFGNESDGISQEAMNMADHIIQIPMFGMAQSLNLSVSVGIILYEAIRQRKQAAYSPALSSEEFTFFKKKWLNQDTE